MSFQSTIELEKQSSELESSTIGEEPQQVTTPVQFKYPNPKRSKQELTCMQQEVVKCMQLLSEVVSARDEHTVFGEHIAHKMRSSKKSHLEISLAQHHIHEILLNLEMGMYQGNLRPTSIRIPSSHLYMASSPSPTASTSTDGEMYNNNSSIDPTNISSSNEENECRNMGAGNSEDVRSYLKNFTFL